jgi:hypothetical protein
VLDSSSEEQPHTVSVKAAMMQMIFFIVL